MAKSNSAAEDETGTQVALFVAAEVPDLTSDELDYDGDLGYSTKADDSLVPIISILQAMSAEVKRQHSKYIEGALDGMLILRAMKKILQVDKQHPLPFIPAGFTHYWVQWEGEPGEGKVVAQFPFDEKPEDAVETKDPQNEGRTFWRMPDGTRIVDTRYHYGLAFWDGSWMPMVIPMAGTNHTVSRQWTGQMKAIKLPNGKPAPAWFRVWALYTQFQSRGTQTWYIYVLDDMGWVRDASLREEGRKINESLDKLTAVDEMPAGDQTDSPV